MKYVLRAIALSVTAVVMLMLVHIQSSQGRYQLIMSGYSTPSMTPTPTPPGCSTIPGTNIQVGAACFPQSSCPAETFPHDPFTFQSPNTCPNDGSADCSASISQAIAAGVAQGGAGDIKFQTPGTYLVNLTTGGTYVNTAGIIPPMNAKMECVAGVTLKMTAIINHDIGIFNLRNGGNTVCGCTFQGPNVGPPPRPLPTPPDPNTANGEWLVNMQGGSGYTVEGNTFTGSVGDSAVGDSDIATSNITVTYNTFFANPLYTFVIDQNTTTASISHNLITDGWLGAEWDGCANGGTIGTNISFTNNMVQAQGGNCSTTGEAGCQGDGLSNQLGYIPVGSGATACNHSGVTIGGGSSSLANYCSGSASISAAYGAVVNGAAGTATETNNIVGPFCQCHSGTGSC